jgi:glucosamine 6-phosphate synthetase-like amidotransferase/phosphosugar isomerase protein
MPSRRDGPPFHMTEMIDAEPALAVRILHRLAGDPNVQRLAASIRETSSAGRPIAVVGCGTSEHAAQAVAELIREGLELARFHPPEDGEIPPGNDPGDVSVVPAFAPGEAGSPVAWPAFEASLKWPPGRAGLVIGVSHEGGTWATNQAIDNAGTLGATVALITAAGRSPAATVSDIVIDTAEIDQSWCHTVGYLSPIIAGVAIQREILGLEFGRQAIESLDPLDVRAVLELALAPSAVASIEGMASHLAGCDQVIVVASGVDRIAARELVLKIEEGAHLPAAMRDVETLLHGHLAGMDGRTGLVAIAADGDDAEARGRRLGHVLRAAREIGIRPAAILAAESLAGYAGAIDPALTPSGRAVMATESSNLAGVGLALIATAVPLQLLTERIARARGVNPDPIRRDDPAYLRAAAASDPEA